MFGIGELLIIAVFFVPWLLALIDILKNDFPGNAKMIWLLAVILAPFFGAVLYFAVGRRQRIRKE